MGERGSIPVKGGGEESVTLFRHWNGCPDAMLGLVDEAFGIMQAGYRYGTAGYPSEVIVLLTNVATKYQRSSAYLGKYPTDGDNTNFGHYTLNIGPAHCKELYWRLEYEEKTIWEKIGTVDDYKEIDRFDLKRRLISDNGDNKRI